jgi:hypothetical protein
LSKTIEVRFGTGWLAMVASTPRLRRMLPSPSRAITCRSGRARARPRQTGVTRPIPIV